MPARRARTPTAAATTTRVCALCTRPFQRAGRLCKRCATACERQARAEQERDYLLWWLSTRDDDLSAQVERLRASARGRALDWLHPPTPLLYKDRLERVIGAAIRTAKTGAVRGNAGQQVA